MPSVAAKTAAVSATAAKRGAASRRASGRRSGARGRLLARGAARSPAQRRRAAAHAARDNACEALRIAQRFAGVFEHAVVTGDFALEVDAAPRDVQRGLEELERADDLLERVEPVVVALKVRGSCKTTRARSSPSSDADSRSGMRIIGRRKPTAHGMSTAATARPSRGGGALRRAAARARADRRAALLRASCAPRRRSRARGAAAARRRRAPTR